jgi:hypothetical protein
MTITKEALYALALGRGGSYGLSRDVIKHYLHDSYAVGTTAASYTYFSQPVGAPWKSDYSKTEVETNLQSSSQLPNGQTFLITRIGMKFISFIDADKTVGEDYVQAYVNLMQSSVVRIKIAGREFDLETPGSNFVPAISVNTGTATSVNAYRSGDTLTSAWISLNPTPIFIDQMVTFSVYQEMGNPDTRVKTILDANATLLNGTYSVIQCVLEGVLTRAK